LILIKIQLAKAINPIDKYFKVHSIIQMVLSFKIIQLLFAL